MTMLTAERIERPASLFGPAPEEPEAAAGVWRQSHSLGGGRLTLDEAIVGAWEGLAAQVAVACPLCGGVLRPRRTHDGVVGSCADCGTTLS